MDDIGVITVDQIPERSLCELRRLADVHTGGDVPAMVRLLLAERIDLVWFNELTTRARRAA